MQNRKASNVPVDAGSVRARVEELLALAQQGDTVADDQALELLRANQDVCDEVGDLARSATVSWLKLIAGESSTLRRAFNQKLQHLKDELGYTDAQLLERLAIDRVVLTWLQLQHAETVYAQRQASGASYAASDYYDRRISQAQKRHLAAVRTLAVLRRLLSPQVPRVSIGRVDQVTVAVPSNPRAQLNGSSGR